jgi:hypothetical protein
MTNEIKSALWISACCIALLTSGCAKQQSGTRLVYFAPPPTAPSAVPAQESGTLVIEEPAKLELEELPLPEASVPFSTPLATRPSPKRAPSGPSSLADSTPEESFVEPPPLEPANNPGQGGRQQLQKVQSEMGASIAQFKRSPLSEPERQTLAEAQAFLDQSTRALKDGDLPRAEKLAVKARLLITAFEQRH